jgi:radical SAM superfamily enzyme YgiQ (UPF0313 family)
VKRAITLVNLFQSSRQGERVLPLGCLWLRASLEAADIEVEIRDFQFVGRELYNSPARLACELDDSHSLVGISTMADSLPLAVALARELKERQPDRQVVLGGWGPTTVARALVERFPWIDFVVRGEGEETLPALIECLAAGRQRELSDIAGLGGRVSGEPFFAPDRPPITDVAGLPEPRHDDLDLSAYSYYTTVTARGCPYQCKFCEIPTVESRRVRNRSVEAVVGELIRAHDQLGVEFVGFQDDIFFLNRKRVEAITQGLESAGVALRWAGFARAGQVRPDWLATLRERGLDHVTFGIEAGSDALLRGMAKALNVRVALEGIIKALSAVAVRCFFLWGFPQEQLSDFFGTAQAVFHAELLGAHVEVGQVVPLAGSPLYLAHEAPLEYYDDYPFCRIIKPPRDPELRQLVVEHPTVFPAFYAFPTPNREEKWAMAGRLCCRE